MNLPRRDYLKTAEVARILEVSRQTLYNWLRRQKIPEPYRHPITCLRMWRPEDIEQILRIMQQGGAG